MGECNHSVWTYKNDQLVLDATGKCLYAVNSQDPRMIECDESDREINHHIHFKIVDNKYICIKNNIDPEDHCLNGNSMNGKAWNLIHQRMSILNGILKARMARLLILLEMLLKIILIYVLLNLNLNYYSNYYIYSRTYFWMLL